MDIFESWRVFKIANEFGDKATLYNIWGKSSRLLYLWGADPSACECTARNPLDRMRMFLAELQRAGRRDYARAAIDFMASPLGGKFAQSKEIHSDKGSLDGEIADAAVTMGALSSMVRKALADNKLTGAEIVVIKEAARQHVSEILEMLDAGGIGGGLMKSENAASREEFKRFIQRTYDYAGRLYASYERRNVTLEIVEKDIARRIAELETQIRMLRVIRSDVLAGKGEETFNRAWHSRQFFVPVSNPADLRHGNGSL